MFLIRGSSLRLGVAGFVSTAYARNLRKNKTFIARAIEVFFIVLAS